MATYQGQTVDVYEDFEDALSTWVETDLQSKINVADSAAEYAGTNGMSALLDGTGLGYIHYPVGSTLTAASLGFWFYSGHLADWSGGPVIVSVCDIAEPPTNVWNTYVVREQSGADNVIRFRIRGTAWANGPTIVDNTWYWLTVLATRNGTCTLRVYDTSAAQVGSDATVTGLDNVTNGFTFGKCGAGALTNSFYFDDIVLDWTDATFPLLGWSVGGGATSKVPQLMAQYRRRRS
jgi:hypothetical protein